MKKLFLAVFLICFSLASTAVVWVAGRYFFQAAVLKNYEYEKLMIKIEAAQRMDSNANAETRN